MIRIIGIPIISFQNLQFLQYLAKLILGICKIEQAESMQNLQLRIFQSYRRFKCMSYQNFNKMVNNQTASIRYENIEALCQILGCTPNELFVFEDDDTTSC